MKGKNASAKRIDADTEAVRRASRVVGIQLTIASSVLVIAALAATFALMLEHLSLRRLFDSNPPQEATIDVGGVDIVFGGILIGAVVILLAGGLSVVATRRAVRPLGDALRLQRAFVSDASHELRTPLAVLDARLQLLQRGLPPGDAAAPIVTELRGNAKTLIEIVNDLLTSAEIGAKRNDEPVELGPVISLAIASMQVLAADKNITILFVDTAPVSSLIPSASLHRCLIALLDNALDFAPPGSTITVSLTAKKQMARLAVRDEGPGIYGIAPERIFDRFARSDAEVGGSTRTGFGIGLSLVRDTVEKVGGRASVFSSSDSGTEIELLIPLAH